MRIEDFIVKLEELGFIENGDRRPDDEFVRSYNPPERLAAAIESLNIGRAVGRTVKAEYSVTFQPPENGLVDELGFPTSTDMVMFNGIATSYRELGTALSPFCEWPSQELLDALRLDAEGFLRWIYHQPIALVTLTDENGEQSDAILRGDSIEHLKPGPKQ